MFPIQSICLVAGECRASEILSAQGDFRSTRSCLQETVEDADNIFLLYPKFHCELNWIEYYWGNCKHFARRHCSCTLAGRLRLGVRVWRGTECQFLSLAAEFGRFSLKLLSR